MKIHYQSKEIYSAVWACYHKDLALSRKCREPGLLCPCSRHDTSRTLQWYTTLILVCTLVHCYNYFFAYMYGWARNYTWSGKKTSNYNSLLVLIAEIDDCTNGHWVKNVLWYGELRGHHSIKNATWRWQWAHLVICTFDVHFLRQDPVKSHKETSILAQYVDGSNSMVLLLTWKSISWLHWRAKLFTGGSTQQRPSAWDIFPSLFQLCWLEKKFLECNHLAYLLSKKSSIVWPNFMWLPAILFKIWILF